MADGVAFAVGALRGEETLRSAPQAAVANGPAALVVPGPPASAAAATATSHKQDTHLRFSIGSRRRSFSFSARAHLLCQSALGGACRPSLRPGRSFWASRRWVTQRGSRGGSRRRGAVQCNRSQSMDGECHRSVGSTTAVVQVQVQVSVQFGFRSGAGRMGGMGISRTPALRPAATRGYRPLPIWGGGGARRAVRLSRTRAIFCRFDLWRWRRWRPTRSMLRPTRE
jgi:hypothetical protein